MITLNSQPTIRHLRQSGSILANKRIYRTPTAEDKNWDICYKFDFPYNVLCNFTSTVFEHNGVKIQSMEGFLQSLKVKDRSTQKKICTLPGFMAKKVGNYLKKSGQFDRVTVYWQGKQYNRNTEEFKQLIQGVYDSKYTQDNLFRKVLKSSKGRKLSHTIGKNDPLDTILTEDEFIENLNSLRDKPNHTIKNLYFNVKNLLSTEKNTKTIAENLKKYQASFVNDIYICGENPLNETRKLQNYGIKNIIDINAPTEVAELHSKQAKKHGLEYLNIVMDKHKNIQNTPETIEKIVNLYNEGNPTYIIAPQKKEANLVLGINYLFNPKSTLADAVLYGTPQKQFIGKLVELDQKLDSKNINRLGWNEHFAETIISRKKTILDLNG